ncbi:MAG: hypothetical protein JSW40_02660 [Candidatus Omnitrophota bacterium]|nr:MAG: hypothetical protein JSW40_02660 [Candidatus Omnitrophota bacterium]
MKMHTTHKSQSIIEYIVYLTAVIILILVGVLGLNVGVRGGLDAAENKIDDELLDRTEPSSDIMEEEFYTPKEENHFDDEWANKDSYGGPEYAPDEFYYHEGPSNMDYVPEDGKVLQTYEGSVEWRPQ